MNGTRITPPLTLDIGDSVLIEGVAAIVIDREVDFVELVEAGSFRSLGIFSAIGLRALNVEAGLDQIS